MRVLPNRAKSNGSSIRVRTGPHARTHLLWRILLGSLVLDPFLPLFVTIRLPEHTAIVLSTSCALFAAPFLAQNFVHNLLSKLRLHHTKQIQNSSSTFPWLIGITAMGLILLKLAVVFRLHIFIALCIVVLLAQGVLRYILTVRKQAQQDRELLERDPWVRAQRWEHQIIIFVTLPLVAARSISIWGALADYPQPDSPERLIYLIVSGLFLGMLRPDRSLFMGMCPKCKHPVPIAFSDLGSCLNCDASLQVTFHAWTHKLPPQRDESVLLQSSEPRTTDTRSYPANPRSKKGVGESKRNRLPFKPR